MTPDQNIIPEKSLLEKTQPEIGASETETFSPYSPYVGSYESKGMGAYVRLGERVGLFRYFLTAEQWEAFLNAPGASLPLLASWADEREATLLLLEGDRPLLVSTPVAQRRYLAASGRYDAAALGERMARDLWGVEAQFAQDDAALLDDGCWTVTWPLAADPVPSGGVPDRLTPGLALDRTGLAGLLGLARDDLPRRADKQRAGKHRAEKHRPRGERKRLDVRLFEAHRGVQARLRGRTPEEAMRLIGRVSAGGFVAHPLAFARAVEQAAGIVPSPHERDVRMILLELERLGLHLYDMARTAEEVGAGLMATCCGQARERLATVCAAYGVSRRLADTVGMLPSGSAVPEPMPLAQAAVAALTPLMPRLRGLHRVYSSRLAGKGRLSPETAWRYAVGGAAGRASGRHVDLRRVESGMRVDALRASGRHEGDALARERVRLAEMNDSLALIRRLIASVGQPDESAPYPPTGEGLGVAEGARGDVWYWVRLDETGCLADVQIRDPALPILGALSDILGDSALEEAAPVLCSLGLSPAGAAL